MDSTIPALRAFNRFYTSFSGALDQRFLGSALSLAEGRLLYEIATRDRPVAIDLQQVIGLDAGYASRMLRKFEANGWVERGRGEDARRRPISLTGAGREMFADLDKRQREVLEQRVAPLPQADRRVLVAALDTARGLLSAGDAAGYNVRTFGPGDMGMITARQAILYHESHGWGAPMEALLGEVTSAFLRDYQEGREQCWIAESGGAMAGSVFVVDAGDGIAQLRLLYVEPWARGMGIGGDLVGRCIAFAREAGYTTLKLWTHTVLESARRIYAGADFEIVKTEIHNEFGHPEQGEIWELALQDGSISGATVQH
ncbi:MAG: MarR family transcriptional regulator [Sphingomonas bacterium]|uniref:bifunctional helix-turn-helix transcriptional regulator/GNAT family N-acetyltransferase n=1 Tax=Sphingomonas bacterium TaxID=1895847 RepID=UPI00260B388A|nr:bifunctional helix-turn-helix transcriptional regulator/GNAT family N-acetyltransferase [Sphingomonas bacterium]MDB5707711.1 MarR family transcriptional regulator [Sphingomonas bacterium]